MAFHFSPTETARYLVAFSILPDAECPGAVFKLFCDTIADVRERLEFNLKHYQGADEVSNCLSCGYTAATLPAAMVKNQTQRHGRCTVAKAVSVMPSGVIRRGEAIVIALR